MNKTTTYLAIGLLTAATHAHAQGWLGESVPWQFQTSADRANRALVNDLVEKKKGGYYDAFKSTYITNIERQVNCNFQPTSAGNSSAADQANNVASPVTNASSGTSASSTGSSSESRDNLGRGGVTNNNQSNSGPITSGVQGSPSTTTTAPINSDRSNGQQDMQVAQNNSGSQTTNVSGSSACQFSSSGAIN
ncbi:hypothetical protein HNP33_002228 [Comamonas odontotermitis]|uniref:Uncharacterized protein n=1 Tax=Comamonas odontotermitis TaxID=379895 RepID=A0ABR6RG69_9BURK|nr:hypothetical protein [Comamonas odontotermitis]MBB6578148.1 hypothetical protein [Comamonas odontotermitis]